jgi:hypothetical protein
MRLEEEDEGQSGGEHQGHVDVSLDSPHHCDEETYANL